MIKSIHGKLTLLHAATFGMLLVSFGFIFYFSMNYILVNSFNKVLYNGARNLEFILFSPPPRISSINWVKKHLEEIMSDEQIAKMEAVFDRAMKRRGLEDVLNDVMDRVFFFSPVYAQIRKIETETGGDLSHAGNKVIARSYSLKERTIPLSEGTYARLLKGEPVYEMVTWNFPRHIRIVSLLVHGKDKAPFVLQLGMSSAEVRTTMGRLRIFILLVVPFLLALAALGGHLFVKRTFRPVSKIVQTVNSITSEDLSLRVESSGSKDEIGRLTDTFNSMIDRLEKSFHSIKEFSGNASHELKTPLTVIRGEIEVALRKTRSALEYKDVLTTIQDETHNLQTIVNDLLFLSRIDSGSISFALADVSLDEPLLESYEENCDFAKNKNIKIILNPIEPVTIKGNRTLLRRMFSNLLQNAVKYTGEGGEVAVRLTHDEEGVLFVISDTGIGIPPQSLPKIFDSFYRVEHSRGEQSDGRHETGGAGLGLTIVKRIVELHKGEIAVESKVGEGTVFTLRL